MDLNFIDRMKIPKPYLADASLLAITAIWGSAYFLIKDVQLTSNAITMLFYRLGIAAIILGVVLFFKKIPLFKNFKYGFILGLLLWVTDVPQSIGLNFTTASNTAFIIGLSAIILPFINYYFNKQLLELKNFIAIAVALAGLWILTGGIHGASLGDWLNLITALAVAAHIFYIDKYVRKDLNPFALAFQQFLTVAVLSLFTVLAFGFSFTIGNTANIWGILYLAIAVNLAAYIVQILAQKHTSSVRVALIFLIEPVFAALFAWTSGHEQFAATSALGGLMILLAMAISELPFEEMFRKITKPT